MSGSPRHPHNTIDECRHPGLACDRVCMECRGSFDVIDRETGSVVGDVDDQTAMNRMLREFGDDWVGHATVTQKVSEAMRATISSEE
jgi:hypothetical protein